MNFREIQFYAIRTRMFIKQLDVPLPTYPYGKYKPYIVGIYGL